MNYRCNKKENSNYNNEYTDSSEPKNRNYQHKNYDNMQYDQYENYKKNNRMSTRNDNYTSKKDLEFNEGIKNWSISSNHQTNDENLYKENQNVNNFEKKNYNPKIHIDKKKRKFFNNGEISNNSNSSIIKNETQYSNNYNTDNRRKFNVNNMNINRNFFNNNNNEYSEHLRPPHNYSNYAHDNYFSNNKKLERNGKQNCYNSNENCIFPLQSNIIPESEKGNKFVKLKISEKINQSNTPNFINQHKYHTTSMLFNNIARENLKARMQINQASFGQDIRTTNIINSRINLSNLNHTNLLVSSINKIRKNLDNSNFYSNNLNSKYNNYNNANYNLGDRAFTGTSPITNTNNSIKINNSEINKPYNDLNVNSFCEKNLSSEKLCNEAQSKLFESNPIIDKNLDLFKIRIKLPHNIEKELLIKRNDSNNLLSISKEFCEKNQLSENLINPIKNQITKAIDSVDTMFMKNLDNKEYYYINKIYELYRNDNNDYEHIDLNLSCITLDNSYESDDSRLNTTI